MAKSITALQIKIDLIKRSLDQAKANYETDPINAGKQIMIYSDQLRQLQIELEMAEDATYQKPRDDDKSL